MPSRFAHWSAAGLVIRINYRISQRYQRIVSSPGTMAWKHSYHQGHPYSETGKVRLTALIYWLPRISSIPYPLHTLGYPGQPTERHSPTLKSNPFY